MFLAWNLDVAYRAKVTEGFVPTADETQVASRHGLDNEQLQWRRNKISQLGSLEYFQREFPLTPDEAFLSSQFDSFITSDLVMAARKTSDIEPYGPLLIGVDPAGQGDDATAIAWRQGHSVTKIEKRHRLTTMEIAGWIAKIIRDELPAKVSIDVGGLGIGIYERLIEQGFSSSLVIATNFGSKPIEPPPLDETGKPSGGPANRRAELWLNMKNALVEGRFSIPDDDALHADLTSCGYKYDFSGRLLLESKIDMRKRGMPSPTALTLALDVLGAQRFADPSREGHQLQPKDRLSECGDLLMPEILPVVIQISAPHPERNDPGAVEIGWYKVSDGLLTMTDEDGKPMAKPHKLGVDEDAQLVAMRLLRERWMNTSGSDFNRKLYYRPLGLA